MSTNNANSDDTNDVRRVDGAGTADTSGTARDFIYQLRRLMYRFAAAEHRRATREGIARRRARITQTNVGGSHDR
jgi:hypothetical protein